MRKKRLVTAALATLIASAISTSANAASPPTKPVTIVLVHGAFAGSSSWNGVVARLQAKGYPVIAAANPLRGLKTDAEYVTRVAASVRGPVVLVGHSYGGAVISEASSDNIVSLVYVAGFATDAGESAESLAAKFPTGTLGSTLAPPVLLADGEKDLYILQAKYWQQFAADSPRQVAMQMAATQRPVTQAALADPAPGKALWKKLPSYFIYGSLDRNIPRDLHAFLAQRARAREVIEVRGASHALMVSNPAKVAALIERAAEAR
jgi:pimeloyl-ACP methyl ester carboxylesterase